MFKPLSILALVAAPAAAAPRIELGGSLGGHAFSSDSELGSHDETMEPGPASAVVLGARVGVPLVSRLLAEAELVLIPTEDDVLGEAATVYGLRTHARFDLARGKVRPFVLAGVGANILRTSSPQMANDTDRQLHWGTGLQVAVSGAIDLRLDLRHAIVPDRAHDGATSDFEITAGMTYRFGKPAPRPAPPMIVLESEEPAPVIVVTPPPPLPAEPVIEELAGIAFEHDSAVIDIDSAPVLERAYQLLAKQRAISVEISGHTSSEGDADRNLQLSLARAEAVKAYLVKRGIAGERIQTVGHGSDLPVANNRTPEGRRANRRIEFRIME